MKSSVEPDEGLAVLIDPSVLGVVRVDKLAQFSFWFQRQTNSLG